MYQDPYKILGVSPEATDDEIKKAYRELTKKYHPDLNPNDPEAERRMNEINAAYDQIKSGNVQQGYGAQQGYGNQQWYGNQQGYSSYSYNPWTGWSQWDGFNGGAQRQSERSEYTAAMNYIRNGMYREALNALSGVPLSERDGRWYYLSAGANMYMGNKVAALEAAKRAVDIDPGNEEYRRLLEQIQSGRDYYDNYSTGFFPGINADRLCLYACACNACMGFPCGPIFCC